jgi:uncharacterized membrane protein YagU involved in acid resistance
MKTDKIVIAAVLGAAAAFLMGFLTHGMLLTDFFEANQGTATGVMRGDTEMLWGPMIIGHLAWGMLFAVIYGRLANITTFADGAKTGALLGFLISLGYDMIMMGSTNILSKTGAAADIVLATIITAIMGGVVAWYLGRGASE